MRNNEIAQILMEIGEHLAMRGENVFKIKAFEKAAQVIGEMERELTNIYKEEGIKGLEEISGVGPSIAGEIEELIKTGKSKYYEKLKKKEPVNLGELMRVEGLGPKGIKKLYDELEITNLEELTKAARAGQIGKLKGFGKKSEEKILRGIEFVKKSGGRFLLGQITAQVKEIEDSLKELKEVEKIIAAGSFRRRKETVGDIDFLVTSNKPEKVISFFTTMPLVVMIAAKGETRAAVKLKSGLNVDLRVVPEESYGAALNYFTGSKEHNITLRQIAIGKGYKLNEYGLYDGEKQIAGRTEEEIYKTLGLQYIEPEIREATGEVDASRHNKLPRLIGYDDLRGDLQIQTTWSDGAASIEEMAREAMKRGLEYILITDHTKRLAMTKGLDEKRILEQMAEIDDLNLKFKINNLKFRILKGSECDILKDGSLDLPDEVLEKLDIVGVSIHSFFNLSREEQTARVIKAIKNPHADILFHPTGRLINKRPAIDLDIEEIIKVAKEIGTVMEIDAFYDRLDLKDDHIRMCVNAGVKLAIDSDAHSPSHFSMLEYGVAQARRGWAERKDVINAWPLEKMLSMLKH
ncbi:MAG: DNA polymerase/3'-5' exonuclease PolX [Patescibacteria group bacterium]